MTNEQTPTVILQDGAGQYYVITAELLAAARVPAERAATIEAMLEEGDTNGFFDWGGLLGDVAKFEGANQTPTPEQTRPTGHNSLNRLNRYALPFE